MLQRRRSLLLPLLLLAVPALQAQTFPAKVVRIIVPYQPGGAADIMARPLAARLQQRWQQPVIVENKSGGDGNIGADFVAKAPADGHTLLFASLASLAIAPSVNTKLPFNPLKDLAPVALVASLPFGLLVHPSVPVQNAEELIAYAKKNPGKLNFAVPGLPNYLAGIDFASQAGISWEYIKYRGAGQASTDLVAGNSNVTIASLVSYLPHVKNGRLKLLAVAGAKRASVSPSTPTISESGLRSYEAEGAQGVLAPAATPRAVIDKIHADINAELATPEMQSLLSEQGAELSNPSPAAMQKSMREEAQRWASVVKIGKVSVE